MAHNCQDILAYRPLSYSVPGCALCGVACDGCLCICLYVLAYLIVGGLSLCWREALSKHLCLVNMFMHLIHWITGFFGKLLPLRMGQLFLFCS